MYFKQKGIACLKTQTLHLATLEINLLEGRRAYFDKTQVAVLEPTIHELEVLKIRRLKLAITKRATFVFA